jgi:hypothetical protein
MSTTDAPRKIKKPVGGERGDPAEMDRGGRASRLQHPTDHTTRSMPTLSQGAVTGPYAAVRITIGTNDLDGHGNVTDKALRRIRGLLWDVPAAAPIRLDLGALRHLDDLLIANLAQLPCARNITIEHEDWRIGRAAQSILKRLLLEVAS